MDILPTLYHDLINNSTGSLSKYKLTMQQINIQERDSKLSQKVLVDYFLAALAAIKSHYGREYGFGNENEKKRATVLPELHMMNWKVYQQITL